MKNKGMLLIGIMSLAPMVAGQADDSKKTCIMTAFKAIAKELKKSEAGEAGMLELEYVHPNIVCLDAEGKTSVISVEEFLTKFKYDKEHATFISFNVGRHTSPFTTVTTKGPTLGKHHTLTFTAREVSPPKVEVHHQYHPYKEIKEVKKLNMKKPTLVFFDME